MRILVIEDNERVAGFLMKGLREIGHIPDLAGNGRDGLHLASSERYDAIVLDRMLPGGVEGLAIVEALRAEGNRTPILILSALGEVDDRIRGLRAGGDDYLAKPFSFGELAARLDALIRRADNAGPERHLAVGDLRLDPLAHAVARAGRPIHLQPREFRMLEYLMRHAGQVVTRTMLLENVWDYHFDPLTSIIDSHVSKLRRKIDAQGETPLLHTVRGVGYKLATDA
jgi:two-component system, OmpR family, response regulator